MTTLTDRPSSPVRVLRGLWRRLRTMRTAIILLLLLAAGSSVGSVFPQRPIQPSVVADWIERNPGWAPIVEDLGLFDVFGSWWFMALAALLVTSLVGCLVPRYRAFARALRSKPRAITSLASRDHHHVGSTDLPPAAVLTAAASVLRRRRFRVQQGNGELAAERGHAREGGSLVFHTAFLVLLAGMAIGKLFGHSGQVAVIEGETFRDTRIEYDSVEEGRLFGGYSGLELTLEDFDVTWHPNGVPEQFVSSVRLTEPTGATRDASIYVNTPLTYGSVRFYQLSWGWAPVIQVRQDGRVLYDGPTIFLDAGPLWRGIAKVPGTEPQQMGLEMLFFTSPELGPDGQPRNAGPQLDDPLIAFEQLLGDLLLDRPQSVFELDPRGLTAADAGVLRLGETAALADGIEVSFTDLKQYSVLQIASNPGALVLLIAALLILVALIPALYAARRRIWIRADERDGRTRLEIAGQALQRKAAFAEEFDAFTRELDRDLSASIGARDG